MNDVPPNKGNRKKGGCLKICLRLVILFVAILVILRIFAPGLIVSQANQQIPRQLNTEGQLKEVKLGLLKGYAALGGLNLEQPEGFGEGNLFSRGKGSVDLDPASLTGDTIRIEDVQLEDLELNLVLNPDENTGSVFNVVAMLPEPKEPKEEEPEPEEPGEPSDLAVALDNFDGRNVRIAFSDNTRETPWNLALTITELSVKGLLYSALPGEHGDIPPAPISLKAHIAQPAGIDARLLLDLRLMPVLGTDIPPVVGALHIIGLDLNLFAPFLVPGAKTAFGGSAFDLHLDFRVGPTLLDIKGRVVTDTGTTYPLEISGSPAAPKIDTAGLLGSVFKRPAAFVGDVVGNVAEAATKTAETAIDTAGTAIKGGVKTVGNVVGGLGKTLKGVATLDLEEAGEGLAEGTVGAVKEAGKTIVDTGAAAAEGMLEAGAIALGDNDELRTWFEAVSERTAAAAENARAFVTSAEFPAGE